MPFSLPRISGKAAAAAFGAGLASALLTLVSARETSSGLSASGAGPIAVALVMGFIAPLTIMIASIGFGVVAGGLAALVGAIAIGVFQLAPAGHAASQADKLGPAALEILVFLVSLGIPAWVLGRIAMHGATSPKPTGVSVSPFRAEERVLGMVAAWSVGLAALGVSFAFLIELVGQGGFAPFMSSLIAKAEPLVAPLLTANRAMFQGMDPHKLATVVVWGAMPFLAARAVLVFVFNLWLAARVAQMSGLLTAPWPDVPRFMRMPRPLAIVFAVALGLTFAGHLIGMLALIVSGALAMGFVLQGLAVIHAMTRGKSGRLPLLIILYLCTALLFPWPLVAAGVLGLLDAGFAFRDRQKLIVKKIKS